MAWPRYTACWLCGRGKPAPIRSNSENDMDLDDWVAVVTVFSLNLALAFGAARGVIAIVASYL